ncbi:hypothetical protein COOONC_06621 [Cooperia oncophora]
MYATLAFLCLSLLSANCAVHKQPAELPVNTAYKDGKTLRLPLNETSSEELLEKWASQALSGLMAAVASRRLDQLDSDDREELHRCSKQAYTVPDHARCVAKVLDITRHIKYRPPKPI